ncbi:GDSL esterase/lipase, partial [Cucurbita argyrosperma subsp. sororia]
MATTAASLPVVLFFLLLLTSPPPSLSFSFSQFKTLFSLAHSLMSRVANLRASRGDFAGSQRARHIAHQLEQGLGLNFWGSMWSLAWDYAKNYAWRDISYSDLYDAVPDMNALLRAFAELTGLESDMARASWVTRNYQSVLRVANSLLKRLLKVFRKSGAWRDVVETVQVEVVNGGLLKDCLELGSGDLKGMVQILKDLALNFYSSTSQRPELLGFDDYIPPYATARGRDILRGINYASAAAGIREETGRQLGGRISFSGQVENYQNTVSQVVDLLGDEDSAAAYLSNQFTPQQYSENLLQQYSDQLRLLYNYGARKFVLFGLGQIGCSPNELAQNSPDGRTCVQKINSANQIFNAGLRSLVDQFNNNQADAKFIYIDSFGIFQDVIDNPPAFGFRVVNTGCCGVGRNNGQITCLPFQTPCSNRDEYLFWDAFHPTEAGNAVIGRRAYSAQRPTDAYPIDIRRLAQL